MMVKGLETMDLRVRAQTFAATRIADALSGHNKLTNLIYPGLDRAERCCRLIPAARTRLSSL